MDGIRFDAIDKIQEFQDLKKESVFFPQLITYAPYTIGSLYALFSGIYGNKNGVNGYYKAFSFDKDNCFTLTQYLKENGYYTETDSPGDGVVPHPGFDNYVLHDEFKINFLERHTNILEKIKDKDPFFLFLRYGSVHVNGVNNVIKKYSDFDKEYFDNKENNFKTYMKWAEESGDYLTSMIKKLKETDLYDNSIIIIFTDHGASVGDKIGEKAYGVYLYDYTIKCVMYILGGKFPKNVEVKNLIRSVDIMPSILDYLNINEVENYKKIQGKTFLPMVRGGEEERIAYSETGGLGGPTPSPDEHNVFSVRTNKWKLIFNKTNKKKEFYNILEDKEEENNLIGKYPENEGNLWKELEKLKG